MDDFRYFFKSTHELSRDGCHLTCLQLEGCEHDDVAPRWKAKDAITSVDEVMTMFANRYRLVNCRLYTAQSEELIYY